MVIRCKNNNGYEERQVLGIIILNYQTWQLTVKCIKAIKKDLLSDYKIFIVDNASPNNSYQKLKEIFQNEPTVQCLLAKENGGYAKGNNIGIKACRQENIKYALITNNDVEFYEDAIIKMKDTLVKKSNAVMVSPKILKKNGQVDSIPFYGVQTFSQYLGIRSAKKLHVNVEKVKETTKVYSVPGCCLMIDVDKFIDMGAFDEGTFMYCEEGTVAKQAWNAGYEVLFEPASKIVHAHGASTGLKNVFIDSNILRSSLYYWKKYEKVSNAKLYIMYYFFSAKLLIKVLLRRIDSNGLAEALKINRQMLRKVLQ